MTPRQRKHRDRMRRRKQKRQAGPWQALEKPEKKRPHNAAKTAPRAPEEPRVKQRPVLISRRGAAFLAVLLMAGQGRGR